MYAGQSLGENASCALLAIGALGPALADDVGSNTGGAVGGAVGGAAIGTVVGGPVGTAVGAGIGAIVGSTLPSHPSVTYQQPVVVGEPLPDTYTYYDVPNYPDYEYIIVNNQRVIVDRHHRVIRVAP